MSGRTTSRLIVISLICLLLSGILYYYNAVRIPGLVALAEDKLRQELDVSAQPVKKVAVVSAPEGVPRYTELTEDIIRNGIRLIEMPVGFVPEGAVSNLEEIKGTITKEDLRPGEQIMRASLSEESKWFGEYQRLKEYNVAGIVGGEIRTGNIVDITVNYGNGLYDVVVPKTKVIKLIDKTIGAGQSGNNGDTVPENGFSQADSRVLVIAVDEDEYRDLELASKMGFLETRLYLDESQPASLKTFDYTAAIRGSKLEGSKIGLHN